MLERLIQWVLALFAVAMLPAGVLISAALKDARLNEETPDLTCEAVQALLFSAQEGDALAAAAPGTDYILPPPRIVAVRPFDRLPQAMDSLRAKWPESQRNWLWRTIGRAKQADLSACAIPLNTRIIIRETRFLPPNARSVFRLGNFRLDPFSVWNDPVPTCENTQVFTVGRVVSEPGGRSALIEYDDCTPDSEMPRYHGRRMGKVGRAVFSNDGWIMQPVTFTAQVVPSPTYSALSRFTAAPGLSGRSVVIGG